MTAPGSTPLPTLGRASPAPLRREGPDKLTGAALYTDDLVYPGAWYGATIRSTEPHARLLGIELDPAFDWSQVVVLTAADIPGENIVSSIKPDQPALAARGHPPPRRARGARRGTRPAPAPRGAPRHPPADRAARRRSSTRSSRPSSSRRTRSAAATWRPAWPRPASSSRASTASATRSSSTSRTRR